MRSIVIGPRVAQGMTTFPSKNLCIGDEIAMHIPIWTDKSGDH